jgi:preprotein translocase subunit SecA
MNALPPRPGIARGTSPESGDVMGGSLARTLRGLRTPSRRRLAGFVAEVETASRGLDGLGESAFSERIDTLREQLRLRGPDSRLLAPTFGLVREAARRELGTPHYDVQLQGGFVMACGAVAEMETGEGKTLTTTLPACAAALAGVPVHVISANDYLVTRDASAMQPLYARLGLRVDAVTEALRDPDLRRAAYASDIAYATTRVLAFDYLRDGIARTQRRGAVRPPLLRGLCLALLDEADAVLVDEAHTPLVLAAPADRRQEQDVHRQALELARGLRRGLDFQVDTATREVVLLERGRAELETLAKPMQGAWSGTRRRERWVVQALRALHVLRRDRDYLVADGVVRIVDSGTGRASRDRSWDQGLQQLVELKEGCTPSAGRETLARISVQRFYRRYLRIAGTTGTAREVTGELRRVYGLGTVRIPTRRPVRRVNRGTRVFAEPRCKWMAVVESARAIHATGRPLLIGTGSVAASEHLANLLRGCNLPHRVLNARQDEDEARIIANAGRPGRITVATQLAGRGTDIELSPEVAQAGGLHVIATEAASAARHDRQLRGRCGRQGDPGSHERIYCLGDDLVLAHVPPALRAHAARLAPPGAALPAWAGEALTWLAQRAEEKRRARLRRNLLARDDDLGTVLAFSGRGE